MIRTGTANGGIFGGIGASNSHTKTRERPSTSGNASESTHSSTTSRTSGFSRKTSFSSTSKSPKSHAQRTRSNSSSAAATSSPERDRDRDAKRDKEKAYTDKRPLPALRLDTAVQHKYKERVAGTPASAKPPDVKDLFQRYVKSVKVDGVDHATVEEIEPLLPTTTPLAKTKMLARPTTGYGSAGPISGNQLQYTSIGAPPSPTLETITYQHIQETSSKRISTLDYLRKANEGRVYWFNTLLFNTPDLKKMPYFESRKLARRATNYLLLGISIPAVIDINGSNALEFLKTLNALLSEFETFQQIHPPDGSSSLSRGRFPQMFKRAATTGKGRRTSSADQIGLPMGNDQGSSNGSTSAGGGNSVASFAINENDLLPGEEYMYLLTPSLPFDPDFYETFATLCDVLIDCYAKLMSLVSSPKDCSTIVAELFSKADARVRKIIVQGVVKEFEDSSRGGVKSEVAGVGRVVLGGLM